MKNIPEGIRSYLASLDHNNTPNGYLCLNEQNEVITAEGWVGDLNLNRLDEQSHVLKSLSILEGLLPPNKTGPIVIHNAHIEKDAYFDIHIFYAEQTVCVVFLDNASSGKLMQQEQQIRLDDDFVNDKQRRGSR